MSDMPAPITLNANQRRHFEILFARLEDVLSKTEALLSGDGTPDQALTIVQDDVPDGFLTIAPQTLAQLRQRIRQLAAALELKPRTLSRRRTMAAMLSGEAIRLEDSLSPQLRGYGAVHPSIGEHLDPALRDIARTLSALASSLSAPRSPHR